MDVLGDSGTLIPSGRCPVDPPTYFIVGVGGRGGGGGSGGGPGGLGRRSRR